jgi:hypothetical protein
MPTAVVLRLVEHDGTDTQEVLAALAAKAAAGDLPRGMVVYFPSPDGEENFVFTGMFRTSHAQAVKAAARLQWRLMQAEDDGEWIPG